eukprot:CAMPEP_0177794686 /NCGR_PEP_ID=MMETSP0491_2-20121128/25785_1 /TAXON_ID=63592 /ORGANISM="Tetraselmis chuii, Strain PLY429" /LENGTH=135 /DNA_ID=CAMNT_0019317373 /DNA_START=726 /DNA_END=1133 /DNA_ORIENTATION=-
MLVNSNIRFMEHLNTQAHRRELLLCFRGIQQTLQHDVQACNDKELHGLRRNCVQYGLQHGILHLKRPLPRHHIDKGPTGLIAISQSSQCIQKLRHLTNPLRHVLCMRCPLEPFCRLNGHGFGFIPVMDIAADKTS